MGAARKNIDRRTSGGQRRFCCGLGMSGGLQGQSGGVFVSILRLAKKITGAGNTAGFLIRVTTATD